MKKKIISTVLTFCMIFALSLVSFAEDNKAVLSVSNVKATVNDELTIDIDITNPLNCAGGSVSVQYDAAVLEPISYQKGIAFGTISPNVNLSYSNNTVKFNWMSGSSLVGGRLISITFRAVSMGKSDITLKNVSLTTVQVKSIPYELKNGSATVESDLLSVELYKSTQKVDKISSGSHTVKIAINDGAFIGKAGYAYVGAYTDNNIMKNVYCSKKISSTDKLIEIPISITNDIDYIKVFIWDENMNPITKAVCYEK